MIDQKLLFDTFNVYYNRGMEAQKSGDYKLAKRSLMLAAETLLKMAKSDTGELKRSRVERANRLFEMANNIEVLKDNKEVKKDSSNQSSNKGQKVKQDDDDSKQWEAATIPNLKFSDVAGLEDVKESIKMRVILPMQFPHVYKQYNKKTGGGILLYGPPGTGKTMIAKAIASEVQAKFYSVKCSDIVSKWFGEAERNIKSLFETARQDNRAIIFFDEFEALASKRGGHSTVMNRLVPELLAQIQGFAETDSQLLLLAATNRPWDIDSAMLRPGRFNELIHVPLPDAPAREYMITKLLKQVPLDDDVNIDLIVQLTDGFNGADVTEFCDRVKEYAILRTIEKGGLKQENITMDDVMKTSQKVKTSVQESYMKQLEKFMKQHEEE